MSILDENEAAALREQMQQSSGQQKTVQPFELLNAEARVRTKLSLVETASEAFAERFAAMLTRARKRSTRITPEPPTMIASAERDSRLSKDGVVCLLHTQANNGATGVALLHIGAPLLFEVVDRRFGGSGERAGGEGHVRSGLELQVAAQLAEVLLAELNAVRGDLWPTLSYRALVTKPEQVGAHLGRQALLSIAWTEQTDDESPASSLTVLLPSDAVDARDHKRIGGEISDAWRRDFSQRIGDASVELVVELGEASLELEELLNLTPGRILRLNRAAHDRLDVRVFGECVFDGTPSAESSHLVLTFDRWHER